MKQKLVARKDGHSITVTAKGGNASVSVDGISGEGCHAVTEALERGLGAVTSSEPTAEAYQAVNQGVNA